MVCKPQRTYDHAPDRSAHLTRRKGIRRSPLSTLAHRCRSSCSAYSSVVMTQLLAHTLTDTSHEAKPSRCSLQCLMRFRPTKPSRDSWPRHVIGTKVCAAQAQALPDQVVPTWDYICTTPSARSRRLRKAPLVIESGGMSRSKHDRLALSSGALV